MFICVYLWFHLIKIDLYNAPIASVQLSPDASMQAVIGDNGTAQLWRLGTLDELLSMGCDKAREYLKNKPPNDRDRHICDDIGTGVKSTNRRG